MKHPPSPSKDSNRPLERFFCHSLREAEGFSARAGAFSLIELLIVIGIVAILAAFAVPAFNSIGQARGVTEAAFQIAAAAELARSEAVARRTFVWLGLQNQTNFGNTDLRVGIVYSKDGSSTNTNGTNLQPIARPLLIQRAGLVAVSAVEVGTNLSAASDLSANTGTGTMEAANTRFTNTIITFTPDGEAMLARTPGASTPFDPLIGIGLRGFRGTTPMTNNDAAVLIDGSIGIPRIFQR